MPELCDQAACPAVALVIYSQGPDILAFCGHHADNLMRPLTDDGWDVYADERTETTR